MVKMVRKDKKKRRKTSVRKLPKKGILWKNWNSCKKCVKKVKSCKFNRKGVKMKVILKMGKNWKFWKKKMWNFHEKNYIILKKK